jgi:hypothetical protein
MLATSNSSVLSASVQQIKDAIDDFRNSSVEQEALNIINRIVSLFNSEPLAEFLTSTLPIIDFQTWWDKSEAKMIGEIEWPNDIEKRVAIQVRLCLQIEQENNVLQYFSRRYCYPKGSHESGYFAAFATKVLDPLVRDISRLIEFRPTSPILLDAMRNLPVSGDDTLDKLLQEACRKFKDPAPQSLQDATEKLWDSWERLKALEDREKNKKKESVKILLDKATDCQEFREQLEQEATTLTNIGNKFHIRHSEPIQVKLNESEQEYLFHRLYSLIRFLLLARNKTNENLRVDS